MKFIRKRKIIPKIRYDKNHRKYIQLGKKRIYITRGQRLSERDLIKYILQNLVVKKKRKSTVSKTGIKKQRIGSISSGPTATGTSGSSGGIPENVVSYAEALGKQTAPTPFPIIKPSRKQQQLLLTDGAEDKKEKQKHNDYDDEVLDLYDAEDDRYYKIPKQFAKKWGYKVQEIGKKYHQQIQKTEQQKKATEDMKKEQQRMKEEQTKHLQAFALQKAEPQAREEFWDMIQDKKVGNKKAIGGQRFQTVQGIIKEMGVKLPADKTITTISKDEIIDILLNTDHVLARNYQNMYEAKLSVIASDIYEGMVTIKKEQDNDVVDDKTEEDDNDHGEGDDGEGDAGSGDLGLEDDVDDIVNNNLGKKKQEGKGNKSGGLYSDQIDRIMKRYKDYFGAIPRDGIMKYILPYVKPKRRLGFIMNLGKEGTKGYHWVAVFIDPVKYKSVEYYDSYGKPCPRDILKDLKIIVDYLKTDDLLKFKENLIKEQSATSVNCGFFATKFLIDRFKGISFDETTGFKVKEKSTVRKSEKEIQQWKKQFPVFDYI
jgi:hypothetical protein